MNPEPILIRPDHVAVHKCIEGFSDEKGRSEIDVVNELTLAAEYGCNKCAGMFIKMGADVNKADSDSNTALVMAATYGFVDTVNLLIEAGADVIQPCGWNCTALGQIARTVGDPDDKLTLKHPGGGQYKECVLALIRGLGADVNKRSDDEMETPLMSVARFGDETILKSLIDAGADVNARGEFYGGTALVSALDSGSPECIKVLIEAGADVNAATYKYERNVLKEALVRTFVCAKSVDMLIKAGAGVNTTGRDDSPTLWSLAFITVEHAHKHQGVLSRGYRCMQLVLQAGCFVNKTSSVISENALHHISASHQRNNVPILILLLAAGERTWTKRKQRILSLADKLEKEVSLKNMCRKVIRKHMMKVKPHGNLFVRVADLEISSLVKSYLLYDVSLNDEYVENDYPIMTDWDRKYYDRYRWFNADEDVSSSENEDVSSSDGEGISSSDYEGISSSDDEWVSSSDSEDISQNAQNDKCCLQ